MLADKSILKINESYENMRFKYSPFPNNQLYKNYGILINIPFYPEYCKDSIYYQDNYKLNLENEFLYCISREIALKNFKGTINWLYINGTAPNSLNMYTLKNIVNSIKIKVKIKFINMKVILSLITIEDLTKFKNIGIDKLDIIANDPEDKFSNFNYSINILCDTVKKILDSNLLVNVKLIYGICSNNENDFISHVESLISSKCSEITLSLNSNYHYDIIENEEIRILEKCGRLLVKSGYKRINLWTYALNSNEKSFDFFKECLLGNFLGLGPNAISSFAKYTIINPDINVYCYNINRNNLNAFICYDQGLSRNNRRFIYNFYKENELNYFSIHPNHFTNMLLFNGAGYVENNKLTPKGINLSHKLMKNLIKNFPSINDNGEKVLNYNEYLRRKKNAGLP